MSSRLFLAISVAVMAGSSSSMRVTSTGFAFPRHPGRYADELDQPDPVEQKSQHGNKRWAAWAHVSQEPTGKAAGGKRLPKKQLLTGPTPEAAKSARDAWIEEFLHPKPKRAKKELSVQDLPRSSNDANELRPSREAAPKNSLTEPRQPNGAQPGSRPGPGRGHTYQSTKPILEQIQQSCILPPEDADQGSWFRRLQVRAHAISCVCCLCHGLSLLLTLVVGQREVEVGAYGTDGEAD